MDERPLTPREGIEARREERETRRSFLRHYGKHNPWKVVAVVLEYLVWAKVLSAGHLENLAQLLKALIPLPKFCNGLIGNSLTDSLIAPAI